MENNNIREQELFLCIERLLCAMDSCTKAIITFKDALIKEKNNKNQDIYRNAIATCEWYLNLQNIKLKETVDAYRNFNLL